MRRGRLRNGSRARRRSAEAYALAESAHREQKRKDGTSPYIGHPLAVAERLAAAGLDEPTVAAAILHDVVEDSDLGVGEIVERFGVEIGELVSALTDDRTIEDYEERKREHRERVAAAGPRAAAIYAADKLVNVRDLRKLYAKIGRGVRGALQRPDRRPRRTVARGPRDAASGASGSSASSRSCEPSSTGSSVSAPAPGTPT